MTTQTLTHARRYVSVTGVSEKDMRLALRLAFCDSRDVKCFMITPEGFLATNSQEALDSRTGPNPEWQPLLFGDFESVSSHAIEWLGRLGAEERRRLCPSTPLEPMTDSATLIGWRLVLIHDEYDGVACRSVLIGPEWYS